MVKFIILSKFDEFDKFDIFQNTCEKRKAIEQKVPEAMMDRERVYIDFNNVLYDTFVVSGTRAGTAHLLSLEGA